MDKQNKDLHINYELHKKLIPNIKVHNDFIYNRTIE